MNTEEKIRTISHEIRNHLSICDMYSQIIKKHTEKDNIKNPSIDNAIDCIQKSIQIIESNLLDLKSINTNEKKAFDFKTLLEKGINLSKAYIVDKNIEYSVFIKNSEIILLDENKFLASVVNIIKNGIEAIEQKGKIEIIAEVKDKKGIIKISNNGKPIPKNKEKTIFERGYTTKKTGSGLGLAICKEYLETQNATLTLLNSTKKQTTFEIEINLD